MHKTSKIEKLLLWSHGLVLVAKNFVFLQECKTKYGNSRNDFPRFLFNEKVLLFELDKMNRWHVVSDNDACNWSHYVVGRMRSSFIIILWHYSVWNLPLTTNISKEKTIVSVCYPHKNYAEWCFVIRSWNCSLGIWITIYFLSTAPIQRG